VTRAKKTFDALRDHVEAHAAKQDQTRFIFTINKRLLSDAKKRAQSLNLSLAQYLTGMILRDVILGGKFDLMETEVPKEYADRMHHLASHLGVTTSDILGLVVELQFTDPVVLRKMEAELKAEAKRKATEAKAKRKK
jgi:hypothetical protein